MKRDMSSTHEKNDELLKIEDKRDQARAADQASDEDTAKCEEIK